MAIGFPGRKLFALAAALPVVGGATMAATGYLGGYFDRQAVVYRSPLGPPRHDLVAVYFSGDMGLQMGPGRGTVAALRERGLPVMAVNSPALFRLARDRAFVDALVADTMRQALARSHAARVVLIGMAFGAGVLDTGLGAVPADLRARIASVVLVQPGTAVYFQANPGELFHPGGRTATRAAPCACFTAAGYLHFAKPAGPEPVQRSPACRCQPRRARRCPAAHPVRPAECGAYHRRCGAVSALTDALSVAFRVARGRGMWPGMDCIVPAPPPPGPIAPGAPPMAPL
jgi:hypothetical protein